MTNDRIFLGWDRPCLHAAVDEFVRRFASGKVLDMEDVAIVLPGARAGRRLIELLVARAERDGLCLIPPLTETPGTVPERLYDVSRPAAGDIVRMLAWVHALQSAGPEALRPVFPRQPEADDFKGWCALAGLCERLHRELAGDMLTFADVATRGGELTDFNEQDRWQALETVRRLYIARIAELGLADQHEERMGAIERSVCRTEKSIVLLATPDLNRVVRDMLEPVTERVSVWVFAPEGMEERFDDFGCTRPEAWRDAVIDLRTEQVEIVERPSNQAAAVLRAIKSYGGRFTASQITVGVADEEVVPYIEQQFEQHDLCAHHAAGLPVGRTGPFRLLEVAADYAERRRTGDFAALVRHPDVETWLDEFGSKDSDDAITALDKFTAAHLQASLRPDAFNALAESETLRGVYSRIEQWLAEFSGSRPLAKWAEPILELVLAVYGGRTLDRNNSTDRVVIQACEAIHAVLQQCHGLDPRVGQELTAATALGFVLRFAEGEAIAMPPRRDAIELLGWLELPLDDAPALVVTGFNEGLVPDSINADAFLPNRLRQHLGLLGNDRRYARDAYALSAILASRPEVQLVAGRRTADFEPLTPSRLLFACDDHEIARRISLFFPDAGDAEKGVRNLLPERPEGRPAQKVPDTFFRVPRPAPLERPITSMRVTSFKDYLACPYRFYLRHVLKLEPIEQPIELDPAGFGTLAHDVLKRFGGDRMKESTDADAIRDFLNAQLDQLVADTFGVDAVPAVRVQIEQLRLRLDAFARWQAKRRSDGWRIEHTELEVGGEQAAFQVDGQPMYLRGRIDRIDRHESTGAWSVLDYKTSEDGDKPDSACSRDGRWRDLQLPLYRHLVRAAGIAIEMQLGYVVLPRDPNRVDVLVAEWAEADLAGADEAARVVVRGVRAGKFPGPASPPPRGFAAYAWICQEGRTAPQLEEDEEGEA